MSLFNKKIPISCRHLWIIPKLLMQKFKFRKLRIIEQIYVQV